MKHKISYSKKNISTMAFIFDSGEIDDCFYGDVVFRQVIDGKEIIGNSHKVVFSIGDIIDKNSLDDISPFTIKDKYCTIENSKKPYKNLLFCFLLEGIDIDIAIQIDKRMKRNFSTYIGMTSIDITSTDTRKQFWKSLVRSFSVETQTITVFGIEEDSNFMYLTTARENGFSIIYDGFPYDLGYRENGDFFSTRQSSVIKSVTQ